MTHDTSNMPAEACSEFLSDPSDEQVPEGAAIALVFVAVFCVLACWAAVVAMAHFIG